MPVISSNALRVPCSFLPCTRSAASRSSSSASLSRSWMSLSVATRVATGIAPRPPIKLVVDHARRLEGVPHVVAEILVLEGRARCTASRRPPGPIPCLSCLAMLSRVLSLVCQLVCVPVPQSTQTGGSRGSGPCSSLPAVVARKQRSRPSGDQATSLLHPAAGRSPEGGRGAGRAGHSARVGDAFPARAGVSARLVGQGSARARPRGRHAGATAAGNRGRSGHRHGRGAAGAALRGRVRQ